VSKKFSNTEQYDADLDAMWAMQTTKEWWTAKYEALGASNIVFHTFDADDTSFTIVSERDVPADLPGFAKKIVGETNHVTQTEKWTRNADAANATIELLFKNIPGGTTGTMSITPSGSGTVWQSDFDIKVNIPMVGGKLEDVIKKETGSNFKQEKAFNDTWLANNA
jgi:hypothetical protein